MKKKIAFMVCMTMLIQCFVFQPAYAAEEVFSVLTEPVWEDTSFYRNGLLRTTRYENPYEGNYKPVVQYVDLDGKVAVEPPPFPGTAPEGITIKNPVVSVAEDFYEGLAFIQYSFSYSVDSPNVDMASAGSESYYMDTSGNLVINMNDVTAGLEEKTGDYVWVEEVGNFKEGHAVINSWGEFFIINNQGQVTGGINPDTYHEVLQNNYYGNGSEGLVPFNRQVDNEDNIWLSGYMDYQKNVVIAPQFENVRNFSDGVALAMQGGLWGLIDKTGKFVMEPQFEDFWINNQYYADIFVDDILIVQKKGAFGAIDRQNNVVVDYQWDCLELPNEGVMGAVSDGKWGFVSSKTGEVLVAPVYDELSYFTGSYALAKTGGSYIVIDRSGNQVGSQSWDFDDIKISVAYPEMIIYEKDGMFGLAKFGGQSTDATKNQSTFKMGPVGAFADSGIDPNKSYIDFALYKFINETDSVDESRVVLIMFSYEGIYQSGGDGLKNIEVHSLINQSLDPGETYESRFFSYFSAEDLLWDSTLRVKKYLLKFDDEASYQSFMAGVPGGGKGIALPLEEGAVWLKNLLGEI